MVLWDYAIQRYASIHNAVPCPLFQADGKTPHVSTFGVQVDISNLCTFGWYEWVYYRDGGSIPKNKENLGRVLGPIKNEGNEMAQAVLSARERVIPRRTICKLCNDDIFSETEKRKCRLFEDLIQTGLGDSMAQPEKPITTKYDQYYDNSAPYSVQLPEDNDLVNTDGTTAYEKPITDHWIHAEINMSQGEAT